MLNNTIKTVNFNINKEIELTCEINITGIKRFKFRLFFIKFLVWCLVVICRIKVDIKEKE